MPIQRLIRSLVTLRWMRSPTARALAWEQNLHSGILALQAGRFEEAQAAYEEALWEAEGFGERDPRLTVTLDNIAALHRLQGQYASAEPVCLRALAVKEVVLGPWHANVASTLRDLTEIYRALGQPERATRCHDRAMAILERAIGPDFEELSEALSKAPALDPSKDA